MLARPSAPGRWTNAIGAVLIAAVAMSACATADAVPDSDASWITDGELEHAWRLAEECLVAKGYDAMLVDRDGRWAISIGGEPSETDYAACTEDANKANAAYNLQRVPTGEAREELAQSLTRCLTDLGIQNITVPSDARIENRTVQAIIEAMGFDSYGPPTWVDDPRFTQALDCLSSHELLFPARFELEG